MNAQSKFVWHDLMTTDVDAAKAFYGELFGWKYRGDDKDPYTHILAGDRDIGGMLKHDASHGPPFWMGYVSSDDVDATLAAVKQSGGRVYSPKRTIEKVGDFAVTGDPSGAAFAPFKFTGKSEPETNARPAPWTFCWDELLSSDPAAAAKFYSNVFGWGPESVEMGPMGTYTLFKRTGVKDEMNADKNAGGMIKLPPGVPQSSWLTYVGVDNVDAIAAKTTRLGGKVMSAPADIPNVGRFAVLIDPQNAAFAVLAPAP